MPKVEFVIRKSVSESLYLGFHDNQMVWSENLERANRYPSKYAVKHHMKFMKLPETAVIEKISNL